MFETLTGRLNQVFNQLRRRGKLSEADVDAAMREVRLALLEADVHYSVVKDFIARVRERAVGAEVSKALNPGQQVIKIVNEELVGTLGEPEPLNLSGPKPRVLMLVGLQGSGKTTAAGKLALQRRTSHAGCRRPVPPGGYPAVTTVGGTVGCPGGGRSRCEAA
jgi:signal recognition particle subunit SRP54